PDDLDGHRAGDTGRVAARARDDDVEQVLAGARLHRQPADGPGGEVRGDGAVQGRHAGRVVPPRVDRGVVGDVGQGFLGDRGDGDRAADAYAAQAEGRGPGHEGDARVVAGRHAHVAARVHGGARADVGPGVIVDRRHADRARHRGGAGPG